jgi:hypothetical protein
VKFAELLQLAIATDESGQLNRKVCSRPLGADRRELSWMVGVGELENVLGSSHVFQAMPSEISELRARGQLVHQQLFGCPGQQDLASVTGGQQSRTAVENLTVILILP